MRRLLGAACVVAVAVLGAPRPAVHADLCTACAAGASAPMPAPAATHANRPKGQH